MYILIPFIPITCNIFEHILKIVKNASVDKLSTFLYRKSLGRIFGIPVINIEVYCIIYNSFCSMLIRYILCSCWYEKNLTACYVNCSSRCYETPASFLHYYKCRKKTRFCSPVTDMLGQIFILCCLQLIKSKKFIFHHIIKNSSIVIIFNRITYCVSIFSYVSYFCKLFDITKQSS